MLSSKNKFLYFSDFPYLKIILNFVLFLNQGGPNRAMAHQTKHTLNRDEYGFTSMYQAAMSLMEEVSCPQIWCFFAQKLLGQTSINKKVIK